MSVSFAEVPSHHLNRPSTEFSGGEHDADENVYYGVRVNVVDEKEEEVDDNNNDDVDYEAHADDDGDEDDSVHAMFIDSAGGRNSQRPLIFIADPKPSVLVCADDSGTRDHRV